MVLTNKPLGDDTEDPVVGGKKGKGKGCAKEHLTVHVADCPARCTVRSRGLGWLYKDHPWAIGLMKPYRVVFNSPQNGQDRIPNHTPIRAALREPKRRAS